MQLLHRLHLSCPGSQLQRRGSSHGTIYLRASPADEHLADLGVAFDSRNPQQVKDAGLGNVVRDEPEVARC